MQNTLNTILAYMCEEVQPGLRMKMYHHLDQNVMCSESMVGCMTKETVKAGA